MSFTWIYRDGVGFDFIGFALLCSGLCWVGRCFGSWVLLGLFYLLRVTHHGMASVINTLCIWSDCEVYRSMRQYTRRQRRTHCSVYTIGPKDSCADAQSCDIYARTAMRGFRFQNRAIMAAFAETSSVVHAGATIYVSYSRVAVLLSSMCSVAT